MNSPPSGPKLFAVGSFDPVEFEIVSEIDDWIQFLQQRGSEGSMESLRPFSF